MDMIFANELTPAYVPPPSEFLKMEMEARGWTESNLAEIINKPLQFISELVNSKRQITGETALRLAIAFGTSADLWLGLETDYQLHLAQERLSEAEVNGIAHRSHLYESMPAPLG